MILRDVAVVTAGLGVASGVSAVGAFRHGSVGVGLLLTSATGWCLLASLVLWEGDTRT